MTGKPNQAIRRQSSLWSLRKARYASPVMVQSTSFTNSLVGSFSCLVMLLTRSLPSVRYFFPPRGSKRHRLAQG